jgi:hypothetical protein
LPNDWHLTNFSSALIMLVLKDNQTKTLLKAHID